MKVQIEIDETLNDDEVLIKCKTISDVVLKVQSAVSDILKESSGLIFYKNDTEYYISLDKILFFETNSGKIDAHTKDDIYEVKFKLYELEEILPASFMRISKSTILNTKHIYAINKNITSSSTVLFENTHKKVYVSRSYYKILKMKLDERRIMK